MNREEIEEQKEVLLTAFISNEIDREQYATNLNRLEKQLMVCNDDMCIEQEIHLYSHKIFFSLGPI